MGGTRAWRFVCAVRRLVAGRLVLVTGLDIRPPVDSGRDALRASAVDVVHDVVQLPRHARDGLLSEMAQIARDLVGLVAGVELVLEPQLAEPGPTFARLDNEVGLADTAD